MKKINKMLVVAAMLVCANLSVYATPPLAIIQKAKQMVENARYQLPIDAGYGLSLTQISYDSRNYTLVYRYNYIVQIERPTNASIWETKKGLIHMLKANPNSEEMQFLKNGITFHYNYYLPDGSFLYAVKITPSDVR